MTDPGDAFRILMQALGRGERVTCVHYACGNFFEVTDQPVQVTCIALADAGSHGATQQERAFSIANAPPSDSVEDREKDLLTRFYGEVQRLSGAHFVHWNMSGATYGFSAIAARYRFLFGQEPPHNFSPDRLYDLDSMIAGQYGDEYARHPKLRSICTLNGFYMPFSRPGSEEATAAERGDYGLIDRSTSEKAHLIAQLLQLLLDGSLRTQGSVGAVVFAKGQCDAVEVVLELGQRFRYVERSLARRYGGRDTLAVDDEYDAQDLLGALLTLFFEDIRPEEHTPEYAGASSRIDFILPDYELAVELKFAREGLTDKKLGEELMVDRDRYAAHPGVRHLVGLVFDHTGYLANPRGLERDLSRETSSDLVAVTVRIFDR